MKGDANTATAYATGRGVPEAPGPAGVPLLELRVFGGFDASIGGRAIDSSYARQRRIQTLLGILAVNHGQELYSDYLADSIWPRSTAEKKRHCFYNLWYLATHAVYPGKGADNPYFERRQYTCRLIDAHVRTDVEEIDRACLELARPGLAPAAALAAYRRLQAAYRGDLLPGEVENAIVARAREDWRDRVAESLAAAARSMMAADEDRTALWMANAALRLSGMREDIARLRMALFAKMGMQAHAVRAFNELEDFLRDEVGVRPSAQSFQLIKQVVGAGDLEFAMPASTSPSRRRRPGKPDAPARDDRRQKAKFVFGDAFPLVDAGAARHV